MRSSDSVPERARSSQPAPVMAAVPVEPQGEQDQVHPCAPRTESHLERWSGLITHPVPSVLVTRQGQRLPLPCLEGLKPFALPSLPTEEIWVFFPTGR